MSLLADVSHTLFYEESPVIEFAAQVLRKRDPRELERGIAEQERNLLIKVPEMRCAPPL